jgi:ATP-dependent RNA helicase DeaD
VSSYLCSRLASLQYSRPTLIQTAAIPHLNRSPFNAPVFPDLIISDLTGQGKTLAYLLPIISQLDNYLNELQALIIVPTRELAVQLERVIAELLLGAAKNRALHPLLTHLLVGEVNPSMISTLQRLNSSAQTRPHIIIATARPASTLLLQQKLVSLSQLRYIIFDEIDSLLLRGDSRPYIIPLIHARAKLDPKWAQNASEQQISAQPRTQIGLISATITPAVWDLAQLQLNSVKFITPRSVEAESKRRGRNLSAKLPQRCKHYYIVADRPYNRTILLQNLLLAIRKQWENHMKRSHRVNPAQITTPAALQPNLLQTTAVFFNKHSEITAHINPINELGFSLGLLTENSSRSERREALKPGKNQVLLCTDIFSRGMDLKPLTHIVNFDLPRESNVYLHRSGRVGRLSSFHARSASVISIISADNKQDLAQLAQLQRQLNLHKITRIYLRGGKIYQASTMELEGGKEAKSEFEVLGRVEKEEFHKRDEEMEFAESEEVAAEVLSEYNH